MSAQRRGEIECGLHVARAGRGGAKGCTGGQCAEKGVLARANAIDAYAPITADNEQEVGTFAEIDVIIPVVVRLVHLPDAQDGIR
jgi:hypothetical protein